MSPHRTSARNVQRFYQQQGLSLAFTLWYLLPAVLGNGAKCSSANAVNSAWSTPAPTSTCRKTLYEGMQKGRARYVWRAQVKYGKKESMTRSREELYVAITKSVGL